MLVLQDKTELYNMKDDAGEKSNLYPGNPEKVKPLLAMLEAWKKGLVPPAFLGLLEDKKYSELHPDRFTPIK